MIPSLELYATGTFAVRTWRFSLAEIAATTKTKVMGAVGEVPVSYSVHSLSCILPPATRRVLSFSSILLASNFSFKKISVSVAGKVLILYVKENFLM